jgi:hypothetical protein
MRIELRRATPAVGSKPAMEKNAPWFECDRPGKPAVEPIVEGLTWNELV